MQRLAIIDNYDSFTYNIVHAVEKILDSDVVVYRNNEVGVEEFSSFDNIIISPGPGLPADAGITMQLLKQYGSIKKILGVCLGHQAIAECFGAKLKNLDTVFHGVSTSIKIIKPDTMFAGLPDIIDVGRYHSWVIDSKTIHEKIEVTAVDNFGNIMAIAHKNYNVKGVQFHPESVLTAYGEKILKNWLLG